MAAIENTEYDKKVLCRQYHSLRFYYGYYDTVNVPFRIGSRTQTVADETEKYYDTWLDFRLIPTERPNVALPKANKKLITIPGKKDPLDLTTYASGHITYGNRTGSWSFYTDNDTVEKLGGFMTVDQDLRSKLHGRILKVVLLDDPGYFYVGQISVGSWTTGQDRSTVSLSYNFYPYKKAVLSSLDKWKFDDFDFQNGVILDLKEKPANGETLTVFGSPERISPHLFATNEGVTLQRFENNTWVSYGSVPTADIESPESIIQGFVINDGEQQLRFTGGGTVTIDYRRGLL